MAGSHHRDGAVRDHARSVPAGARRATCRRPLAALGVEGRALEPLRLLALATFLDSIDESRAGIRRAPGSFPLLDAATAGAVSFKGESTEVREKIDDVG